MTCARGDKSFFRRERNLVTRNQPGQPSMSPARCGHISLHKPCPEVRLVQETRPVSSSININKTGVLNFFFYLF